MDEAASLLDVHKNTIREWIKAGLPTTDLRRPALILGQDLSSFLQSRRLKNKQRCQAGEIYCVRCRVPRCPAADMADYVPITTMVGDLIAICPQCSCMMRRRVNVAKLEQVRGKIDVLFPLTLRHINESSLASPNSDFE